MSTQPKFETEQMIVSRRLLEQAVKLFSIPMSLFRVESSNYSSSRTDLIAWKNRSDLRECQKQSE